MDSTVYQRLMLCSFFSGPMIDPPGLPVLHASFAILIRSVADRWPAENCKQNCSNQYRPDFSCFLYISLTRAPGLAVDTQLSPLLAPLCSPVASAPSRKVGFTIRNSQDACCKPGCTYRVQTRVKIAHNTPDFTLAEISYTCGVDTLIGRKAIRMF